MNQARAETPGSGAIGILGGTFDPVHFGHLRAALEVLAACRLAAVHLMPCAQPPHRPAPAAPVELRLRMLREAIACEPRLVADERELRRPGPSYMVDSLTLLRGENPARGLCLVLGADAFLGLPSWHRWREIVALAHIIVVHRPGWQLQAEGELGRLLAERRDDDVAALHRAAAGIIRVQPVTSLDISSSAIRELASRGGDPRFLVPEPVRDLILSTGCYRQPPGPKEKQLRA